MKLSQPNFCFIWDDTVEQMIVCLSHLDHPSSQTKRIMEKINENMGSLEMRERGGIKHPITCSLIVSALHCSIHLHEKKPKRKKYEREVHICCDYPPSRCLFVITPCSLPPTTNTSYQYLENTQHVKKKYI